METNNSDLERLKKLEETIKGFGRQQAMSIVREAVNEVNKMNKDSEYELKLTEREDDN